MYVSSVTSVSACSLNQQYNSCIYIEPKVSRGGFYLKHNSY